MTGTLTETKAAGPFSSGDTDFLNRDARVPSALKLGAIVGVAACGSLDVHNWYVPLCVGVACACAS